MGLGLLASTAARFRAEWEALPYVACLVSELLRCTEVVPAEKIFYLDLEDDTDRFGIADPKTV